MKTITLQFFADPGHGWLKVAKTNKILNTILDKISNYSFESDTHLFLEEACDAGLFIQALHNNGYSKEQIKIKYYSSNRFSKIRGYSRYIYKVGCNG